MTIKTIKIYGIHNCDNVKKARNYLITNNLDFEFIDLRKNPITIDKLQEFINFIGMDKLINKRSTTYRNLTKSQKNNLTQELILTNPTIIKRPVFELSTTDKSTINFIVGFNPKVLKSIL